MQTSTSVAPAPSLGIREFSRQSGYSEAKVRRAMRELSIKGQFQGRGKATLLNPSEQERLALHIDEVELQGSDRPSAPAAKAPVTSAAKPSPVKTSPKPSKLVGVQPTPGESASNAIASPPEAPPATPSLPQDPTEVAEPAAADPTADHSELLDQLWEARQSIHSPDSTGPAQATPHPPAPLPPAPIPQSSIPPQPHPAPSTMNQPSSPNAPEPDSPNQPLSAPVPPQTSPTYYDPYFDAHPAIAPATQIQPGNHRQTLAPPNLPESYDLAQFRSDETITTLADPGAIAAQAMGAIEALVHGMDADIQQQRIHLEETQRAAQALRLKAKQLQDKKIEYMIQSSTLGQAQQQSTHELQEALEGIQTLGKSPSGEQTSPSSSPSSPSPSA